MHSSCNLSIVFYYLYWLTSTVTHSLCAAFKVFFWVDRIKLCCLLVYLAYYTLFIHPSIPPFMHASNLDNGLLACHVRRIITSNGDWWTLERTARRWPSLQDLPSCQSHLPISHCPVNSERVRAHMPLFVLHFQPWWRFWDDFRPSQCPCGIASSSRKWCRGPAGLGKGSDLSDFFPRDQYPHSCEAWWQIDESVSDRWETWMKVMGGGRGGHLRCGRGRSSITTLCALLIASARQTIFKRNLLTQTWACLFLFPSNSFSPLSFRPRFMCSACFRGPPTRVSSPESVGPRYPRPLWEAFQAAAVLNAICSRS